jgi:tyramine---L-glutamate ligase
MPHVLLYEFLTGGGLPADAEAAENESLRREGGAMLAALAADFAALEGVTTTVILDSRQDSDGVPWTRCRIVPVHKAGGDCEALTNYCRDADWTVVIAPEFDGLLESRLRIVEAAGGRLLGPSPRLAALAADKQRTADHLAAVGVPAAFGELIDAGSLLNVAKAIGYPVVFKRRDGAGSKDVRLLADRDAAIGFRTEKFEEGRLERFYPGIAASVAVLCGPDGLFPLPACRQRLSDDGRFRYLGGSCPLEPALAERAPLLAVRAIRSLPDPVGYLGVDLVLGANPNGQGDVVIEVNPRLTTSYVGLRAVAGGNLAAAMLAIAEGRLPSLSFSGQITHFDADGTLRGASLPAAIES